MKKTVLTIVSFLAIQCSLFAQEFESILLAKDDANTLMQGYMNPVMKGLIYGMNSGWATTAKTHKKFGFDITISANLATVPSKDEVFTFVSSNMVKVPGGGSTEVQTVMGEDTSTTLSIEQTVSAGEMSTVVSSNFEMPGGIKNELPLNAVPTPTIQLGVGLPIANTDLKIRFLPSVGTDNIKAQLFGLGLQHDLMQYFGPLDKLPLNVSVLAAFTNMSVDYDIQSESSISGTDQKAEFKLDSYTVQALASLDFPFIAIYGSMGYSSGTSTLKMLGTYNLEYEAAPELSESIKDPFNLNFDAKGFKTTLGARFSLGPLKLFGDYTLQEYNTISAGIALNFR